MKPFFQRLFMHILFICTLFSFSRQTVYPYEQKSNLPVIYINTENSRPVISKEDYLPARIVIKSSELSENLDTITEIRGRGNSTWNFEKKPYRIKLDKKYNVLNLPAKAKSWTLLANHADKTLIRNAVAFKISEVAGLEFTPSVRFVDLVLNGDFLGSYMLSDQMQVDKDRVNVDELTHDDVDDDIITGGYLLEIDGFAASEPEWFTTPKGLKITIKSPDEEEITDKQRSYIINFVKDFENRLFSSDFKDPEKGYRAMADTQTLVNWYIGCELTGNSDSFWSTYIYKKRGIDKLYFGPMWDYDIAFNNDDRLGNATRKLMREYAHNPRTWIERMYEDEWFQNAVWKRWQELVNDGLLSKLTDYIDGQALLIDESQKLNFQLWGGVQKKVYREQFLFGTYAQGVDYLKTYLSDRIDFLTESFEYTSPPKPSDTFEADDAYYMIMSRKSKNVIGLQGGSVDENTNLVLWEPITGDDSQLWEIVEAGTDKYLLINKKSGLAITGNGKPNTLVQKNVTEGNNKQLWEIVPVNTGNAYCIVNAASDCSMNNSGGSLENGTPVIEYDKGIVFNGEYNTVQSENRQWYLQKTEMKELMSVQDTPHSFSLSIYPNPVADRLNITYISDEGGEIFIGLNDLLGKELYRTSYYSNAGKNTLEVPVSSYNDGIYILSLFSDKSKKRIIRKIIIRK